MTGIEADSGQSALPGDDTPPGQAVPLGQAAPVSSGAPSSNLASDDDGLSQPSADAFATRPQFDAPHPDDRPPPPELTRRGRVKKWDRPPPPRDWRWYVGHVGRVLIAVGILMFGFVAYQLWGTGIENARAQSALENDFEELLDEFEAPVFSPDDSAAVEASGPEPAASDDDVGSSDDATGAADDDSTGLVTEDAPVEPAEIDLATVVPADEQNIPLVEDGDALAKIEIPEIGVSDIVVAGIQVSDLKRGPGHFPDTPLPGQLGNAAIAGHRTTYGQPFFRVDELQPGDEIRVTTLNGVFTYLVTGTEIVSPSNYQVVATTDPTRSTLTLVSCHPRYTARERIIVSAELDPNASGTVGEPVLNYGRPEEPEQATSDEVADEQLPSEEVGNADGATGSDVPAASADDGTTGLLEQESGDVPETATEVVEQQAGQTEQEIADVFGKGWFSDPSANAQVGLWGLALSAIAILAYFLSRRVRHDWVGFTVGIAPFIVTLYFFFQNVNRLLPPNL